MRRGPFAGWSIRWSERLSSRFLWKRLAQRMYPRDVDDDRNRPDPAFDEAIDVLDLAVARVEAVRKNSTKAERDEASRLADEALRLANEARESREGGARSGTIHGLVDSLE